MADRGGKGQPYGGGGGMSGARQREDLRRPPAPLTRTPAPAAQTLQAPTPKPPPPVPFIGSAANPPPEVRSNRTMWQWWSFADGVYFRWSMEQLEFAVRIRRRMWNRLGKVLAKHRWAQQFRGKYFRPVWERKTVKRWERVTASPSQ